MRRITLWVLSTISAMVLLFSYHTSTSASASQSVVAERSANGTDSTGASGSGSATGAGSSGSGQADPGASGSSGSDGTYTGDAVTTRYGDVQVRITVEGGKVTRAEVTQVPWSDRRDQEINSRAVPVLNSEAVQAQSAQIDMVSGATYTSQGYAQSLQAALDQANL